MSYYQQYQGRTDFHTGSAGTITNPNYPVIGNNQDEQEDPQAARSLGKRRDEETTLVNRLYADTYRGRPGEKPSIRPSQRKNRNEVYALTNLSLVKAKHFKGGKLSCEMELAQGIQSTLINGEFLLVLRTDGRIVALSEEAEHHLGKSMRSLYTQCINMFECLDQTDGPKLKSILDSSVNDLGQEHRLVCTFRLPKGKRPSRIREDIKTITMAGHFYSCHDSSSPSSTTNEKLFIARCEALVSATTNGSSSSQTDSISTNAHANAMLKFTLNDDMSVSTISSNVGEILGYRKHEMIGVWFGRFLPTDDLQHFEANRKKSYQPERSEQQQQSQAPSSICDIFDIYTKNGDGRLSFLYQIRPKRERRARSLKFSVTAQLIDPSLRDEYLKHIQAEPMTNQKPGKAEQVNRGPSSVPKASEDALMANSPSLSGGLLTFDNGSYHDFIQQYSPFNRSLSKVVAPVKFPDESWPNLFDFDYKQYPIDNTFQFDTTEFFDQCPADQELTSLLDDYLGVFTSGGAFC